ncbi:hypothetical protein [Lactovum miscens]|uniref:Uncharacterized protein n=1 Tax=Lactovum miscens TaxID=190387 RepID=A0A841C8U0_9LACT|nr:hypothetical protein [Lactovum miscens]MBB5888138.1 hypothetical protein [Lactovum miscens]
MKSTKATEEVFKAKTHLLKAKKIMSEYVFEHQPNSFKKLNKLIDELDNFSLEINADSSTITGDQDPRILDPHSINSHKYK